MTTFDTRSTTGLSHRSEDQVSQNAYDVALLVIRLALGFLLVGHGTQKLFGWFGGGGLEGTGQFFTMVGYPSGKTFALVAGLTETLGGLGLALGLLTPLAGAAVLGTMLNAMSVNSGGGFFMMDKDGGMELDILVAATATGLALAGPGRIAADRFLPVLRAHRLAYGVAAVILAAITAGVVLLVRN
ncbi:MULTISPECIES: DoxX family protein [unclassified Streptomyces]|uniref:DoxX family protein n=1 Tax=unclassified Streptomyces TaxID=2593676 RepID=UPI002E7A8677|nr:MULTISPECIES: DoxX family protein [unclassified Streptomyces]MEE1758803.1 DoxX family protein [Streptomyces sp. SP18BB07]MEE1831559.1 DoxX family protein [Streptomyces sp. SP17KL33]